MPEDYDVVIAGGGPAGAALALALQTNCLRIALLEARGGEANEDDGRTIALAHGSRLILERLGVWGNLAPVTTPIYDIEISQQRAFGRVALNAAAAGVPALGYVVSYAALQRILNAALAPDLVTVMTHSALQAVRGTDDSAELTIASAGKVRNLYARLAAIADGGSQLALAHVRVRDYGQSALICSVSSELPHKNRAFERFASQGPLALLPDNNNWSVVWTTLPEHAKELVALTDAQFCSRLHAAFGSAVGTFSIAGKRQIFPLALKYAMRPVQPRTVLIGNAAQTLHPVAGQGFNLALRDAWELAHALATSAVRDVGAAATLDKYFSQRRYDRIATILFTDTLIRLFCKDIPLLKSGRSLALAALAAIPGAKNFLTRRMMFGTRR